ncbi:MAG TPA: hypothetical protein PK668_20595 [Myxococcota bacterium]|nr:hypothetical protein [Myxococcota bacterium]HRY96230.1 hypothetical protein [Myxococcota bacterium]
MRSTRFVVCALLSAALALPARAQDEGGGEDLSEDPVFSVNGLVQLQSGMFVPLLSDLFQAHENTGEIRNIDGQPTGEPCDPVMTPQKPCYPTDHGQEAGSLSMFRLSAQLEADWRPLADYQLHAIVRAAKSLETDADGMAQMPRPSISLDPGKRRAEARAFVNRNYYTEFDLREFYLDAFVSEDLSFRIGRQQVTWGETGQFRLLDVINPIDSTWHFGSIESFEDQRIPLWIVKGLWEFPDIDHALEVVWVPGIDRPEDSVTVPLTLVGAWGLPYTNTPSPYVVDEKVFLYPKNSIEDTMRIGFRWKGNLTPALGYSVIYYYTHQQSPPIPFYYDRVRNEDGSYSSTHLEKLYLGFPRQHIAGLSLDFTLENPVGMVVRFEAAIEPDRMYPRTSTTGNTLQDPDVPRRVHFLQPRYPALTTALVFMRPTMIRFLNPEQNITLMLQLMYSGVFIPDENETDRYDLVEIPGFNDYLVTQHQLRVIFAAFTTYLHGMLMPKVVVAWIMPDLARVSGADVFNDSSGFVSASLAVRLGSYWRLNLALTDFFGNDAYSGVGLFRDRDEINLSILCQF